MNDCRLFANALPPKAWLAMAWIFGIVSIIWIAAVLICYMVVEYENNRVWFTCARIMPVCVKR